MNKSICGFSMCLFLLCIHVDLLAQTDSIVPYSKAYGRIIGNSNLLTAKIRSFILGDSLATILHSEKAILEAQGDDYLYYRVLCDSTISAEIAYTFDEKGLLISIGIEFFQSCKHTVVGNLSDEFLINLSRHYENCGETETGSFQCESNTGVHVEYQTQKDEMCVVHTQIEFY